MAWWNPQDSRRTALSQAPTTAVTNWSPRTRWQAAAGCSTWVGAVGCCRVWRAQPPRSPAQGAQACRATYQRDVYRAAWHVEQHSRSTTWRGRPSSITPLTARARSARRCRKTHTCPSTKVVRHARFWGLRCVQWAGPGSRGWQGCLGSAFAPGQCPTALVLLRPKWRKSAAQLLAGRLDAKS